MKPQGHLGARYALNALMRATLGQRPDIPPPTDLGTTERFPKVSVLSAAQRRAIFAKANRPKSTLG